MHKVPIEELKEGMTLAEPILDPVGRVLLGKGEPLTRLYIHKLEQWGIYEVSVDETPIAARPDSGAGTDPEAEAEASWFESSVAAIDARLDHAFAEVESDEYMSIIKGIARKHLVEQASRKRAAPPR